MNIEGLEKVEASKKDPRGLRLYEVGCLGGSRATSLEDITYGFEIEFSGLYSRNALNRFKTYMKRSKLPYVYSGKYGKNDVKCWTLGTDGSIVTERFGDRGYEIVSPILQAKDFHSLNSVLNGIVEILEARVNSSCGLHVHFGGLSHASPFSPLDGGLSRAKADASVWLFSKLKPMLWDRMVTYSRSQNGYASTFEDGNFEDDKYLALSAAGFGHGKNPTIECRLHQGSLCYDEITEWAGAVGRFLWECFNGDICFKIDPDLDCIDLAISLLEQIGYDKKEAASLLLTRVHRMSKLYGIHEIAHKPFSWENVL